MKDDHDKIIDRLEDERHEEVAELLACQAGAARTNFMTPAQCAAQFDNYAATNPSKDSAHSLRFCAKFLREFCAGGIDAPKTSQAAINNLADDEAHYPMLARMWHEGIFETRSLPSGQVEFRELCDRYYTTQLTVDEVDKLGDEIKAYAAALREGHARGGPIP